MGKGGTQTAYLFIVLLIFVLFVIVLYYAAVHGIVGETLDKLFNR